MVVKKPLNKDGYFLGGFTWQAGGVAIRFPWKYECKTFKFYEGTQVLDFKSQGEPLLSTKDGLFVP